ncbi:MAG: ferritin family protein [Spirochaetes bacterium]|nr:ferritin family protein [Spirochaetota bacterium]
MNVFNVSEIFQFAIRIEENGEKFYREMAAKFGQEMIKDLFLLLADEELLHKETFTDLLSKGEDYKPHESYPGEYFAYLKAYADILIFNKEQLAKEMEDISTVMDALNFAIKREWESISYYNEIKGAVPEGQHSKIEMIVQEERKHFVKLVAEKNRLLSA